MKKNTNKNSNRNNNNDNRRNTKSPFLPSVLLANLYKKKTP